MKPNNQILFISIIFIYLTACNGNSNTNTNRIDSDIKSKTLVLAKKGKYAIKSGIIDYKTTLMNIPVVQTWCFDNYGTLEKRSTQMEMMGVKVNSVDIIKEDFTYHLDLDKKTCTKTRIINKYQNIDFENLTIEIQNEMKIRKIGEEKFLNRSCIKYSIDNKKLKMKGMYLVYKGIPLKTDIDMSNMKIMFEAIKITENPHLPPNTFDVPADIKVENE